MSQEDYKIKVLEKALEYAVISADKEGCYYCPIGCSKSTCEFAEDSEQCHDYIMETFIKQAEKDMEVK